MKRSIIIYLINFEIGNEVMSKIICNLMNNDKLQFYKENPDVYIKEVLGFDLFPWQTYVLKEYIKDQNKNWFLKKIGKYSPAKKMFWQAIEIIHKDLLGKEVKNSKKLLYSPRYI